MKNVMKHRFCQTCWMKHKVICDFENLLNTQDIVTFQTLLKKTNFFISPLLVK